MLSMHSRLAVSALRALIVFVTLGFSSVQAAGDIEAGAILADTCKGCHAVDSYNNVYPTYHVPRIGGQSAEYLEAALKLYREGNRDHSTMTAQAASYSDQDIADISAYIASIVPELKAGTPKSQAPEAANVCQSCHGETGIGQISMYPYLAGQHQDYLIQAMSDYKSGARKGPNAMVMQAQLMMLSDDDIKAIAAYYAKQDGLTALPMN